jgi:hypothetical protein
MLQLGPGVPPIDTSLLPWNTAGAPEGQPSIFQLITRNNRAMEDLAEIIVCNSFHEAEPGAFELYPNVLPVGPLFADGQFQKPVGQFFPEDARCLEWLDAQPDRSVVYVAFGSFTILDSRQFEELALGLVLTGRPFLWVVRPDSTAGLSEAWLDEFRQRISGTGMIVSWCSQQKVRSSCAVPDGPRSSLDGDTTVHGSFFAGPGTSCGGVLRVALRVELDDGRGAERGAVPVLAVLHGPVPEQELHLRHVGERSGDGAGPRRRRDRGGSERQSDASRRRRRDQGESARTKGCVLQVPGRGRVFV